MKTELKVAQLLTNQKKTLAIAESCTGGLLSARLTDIPGASHYLIGAAVTYKNVAKIKWLKVRPSTLQKYGAVSEQTAREMAQGIRRAFKTDLGLSITGIAGPEGTSRRKPVGTVFICVSRLKENLCLHFRFFGDRRSIRKQATTQALKLLLEFLQ